MSFFYSKCILFSISVTKSNNLAQIPLFHSELTNEKFGVKSEIVPRLKSNALKVHHLQLSYFHVKKEFETVTLMKLIFITSVKLC